jgi:DNA-binding NarL/FixJ family response regulator
VDSVPDSSSSSKVRGPKKATRAPDFDPQPVLALISWLSHNPAAWGKSLQEALSESSPHALRVRFDLPHRVASESGSICIDAYRYGVISAAPNAPVRVIAAAATTCANVLRTIEQQHFMRFLTAHPKILLPRPLTMREREVLTLRHADMSQKQIAEILCITEYTVKDHWKRAYAKLGAHTVLQMVRLSEEAGLFHYLG